MPSLLICTDCGGHGSYLIDETDGVQLRLQCKLCGGTGDGANNPPFDTSAYWKSRYGRGASSGGGSRGEEAAMKARLIDRAIEDVQAGSVLDYGCGDGYVGSLVTRPVKRWFSYDPNVEGKETPPIGRFDLVLSVDVLFHLPGDEEYRDYLGGLFACALRAVFVWSTNHDNRRGHHHVLDRAWLADVPDGWAVKWAIETGFEQKWAWLVEKA